jgi:hypothetical protein
MQTILGTEGCKKLAEIAPERMLAVIPSTDLSVREALDAIVDLTDFLAILEAQRATLTIALEEQRGAAPEEITSLEEYRTYHAHGQSLVARQEDVRDVSALAAQRRGLLAELLRQALPDGVWYRHGARRVRVAYSGRAYSLVIERPEGTLTVGCTAR